METKLEPFLLHVKITKRWTYERIEWGRDARSVFATAAAVEPKLVEQKTSRC